MFIKIQSIMNQRNISAYKLSKETGISQVALSNWKSGRCKPSLDKLKILAEYFGVQLEELL